MGDRKKTDRAKGEIIPDIQELIVLCFGIFLFRRTEDIDTTSLLSARYPSVLCHKQPFSYS